jgi:hypothetical protein
LQRLVKGQITSIRCDIGYYINHGAKKTPAKEIVLLLLVSRCHEKFMGQKADDIYHLSMIALPPYDPSCSRSLSQRDAAIG